MNQELLRARFIRPVGPARALLIGLLLLIPVVWMACAGSEAAPDRIGSMKRELTLPPDEQARMPSQVKEFLLDKSTEVLGWTEQGEMVLGGSTKGFSGRYVLVHDRETWTLSPLRDGLFVNLNRKVEGIGFARKGRNAVGAMLCDVELAVYLGPLLVFPGKAAMALDRDDLPLVVRKVNFDQNRFGTPFELSRVTSQEDRRDVARDAVLFPLASILVGGVLDSALRCVY